MTQGQLDLFGYAIIGVPPPGCDFGDYAAAAAGDLDTTPRDLQGGTARPAAVRPIDLKTNKETQR